MNEFAIKQERILNLLQQHNLDALALRRSGNFAWATCGASSYINRAADNGLATLLITRTGRYLLTTNVESPRFIHEEKLGEQGWEVIGEPWYKPGTAYEQLTAGLRVGSDGNLPGTTDLSAALARVRVNLLPVEQARFRQLARSCADAMNAAIRRVQPGQSEYELASMLAYEGEARGLQVIVNLIATDERIFNFRHPLPVEKKLDKYAMLILGGRRQGLICSVTRLIHFGRLSDELRQKQQATATVDATLIAHTRPGTTLGEIFAYGQAAYAATGFGDEWQLHHQGGAAGYDGREYLGLPGAPEVVEAGQVFSWNPSITGTKSEDTVLIGAQGNEVLTAIAGWPTLSITVGNQVIERPAILEIKD